MLFYFISLCSGVTILGAQEGQAIVLLSAEQLKQLGITLPTPGNPALPPPEKDPPLPRSSSSSDDAMDIDVAFSPSSSPTAGKGRGAYSSSALRTITTVTTVSSSTSSIISSSSSSMMVTHQRAHPPKPKPPDKLPPNWKTAKDEDGEIYYYHAITRETQWDPPTWDEPTLLPKTSKKVVPKQVDKTAHKLMATGTIASDTDQAKKARDKFRTAMSKHIVKCLSPYLKSDCKQGRIISTEDFKHLARKLTHNILMKEVKQVQVWEDLEFNSNVKHKASEYVKKYLRKMGALYKPKDDL